MGEPAGLAGSGAAGGRRGRQAWAGSGRIEPWRIAATAKRGRTGF
ncbi:hypothetical protein BSIN_2469 [Burkholderia singularis]|uniref:Uncharacterized protein n=1 Tax=Burkholderia singularis TaxID=1503053 RepID=A0A238H1W4_9BURK|nr:hypothetical protein BSIN_2469 [Burkholderia singularis]